MIETDDYWICENRFIFKYKFNEKLDKYYDLIKLYDTLIFSNYTDVNICIKTNNFYDKEYHNIYFFSRFNQKIILPENLTHITFSYHFNQELILPYTLTQLTFGESFNQVVELPESLTHLTFGFYFNRVVKLPESLTHLTFGYDFNQKVNIPLKLKYLRLDCNNLCLIENLPNNLEELVLGKYFNLELNNLPNSVHIIRFSPDNIYYTRELNNLVDSIEILELPPNYQNKIKNIPQRLKKIKLSKKYKYIEDFKTFDLDLETY
jgi:hypothetical protein